MDRRNPTELSALIVVALFSLLFVFSGLRLAGGSRAAGDVGAGAFPLILGSIGVLLSAGLAVLALSRMRRPLEGAPRETAGQITLDLSPQDRAAALKSIGLFVAIAVMAVVFLAFLGVFVSIAFSCMATMRFIDRLSWVKSAVISLVATIAIYVIFVHLIGLPLALFGM